MDVRWAPVMAVSIFVGIGLAVKFGGITYGDRCTKAGFKGPQHEACVMRLTKYNVMYEENLPKENAVTR